ncbi:MAG: ribokinase [Anaerolineae bacterium]|nr:ribokinase [Anaerolineae bacterium]
MNRVLVVGSINMDQIFRLAHLPRPGETMLAGDVLTVPGGKGANQAVAAALMGGRVQMVGRLGADPFGRSLRAGLIEAGVDVTTVREDEAAASGVALILLAEGYDNSIIVASGANMRVTPADLDAVNWAAVDVLLVQLEIPFETVAEAMRRARAAGALVILDPAPSRGCPADLLALADILTPNETEASDLAGMPITDVTSAMAAAQRLRSAERQRVIVKLGGQGVVVCDEDGCRHRPAIPVPVVDTTAAGDAFCGALAARLAAGAPFEDALRYAMAAGALAVTVLGAQPSLPTLRSVEELLARSRHMKM